MSEDDSIRVVLEQMGIHQDEIHKMNLTQLVYIKHNDD